MPRVGARRCTIIALTRWDLAEAALPSLAWGPFPRRRVDREGRTNFETICAGASIVASRGGFCRIRRCLRRAVRRQISDPGNSLPTPISSKPELQGVPPDPVAVPGFLDRLFGLRQNKHPTVSRWTASQSTQAGAIWLGGATHYRMGMASDANAEGYVAKLGADSKPIWSALTKQEGRRHGGRCQTVASCSRRATSWAIAGKPYQLK